MTNGTERGIRMADSFVPLLCQFDKNYSDLARRNGESYFGMWVLEEKGERPEGVTQKQLCEITHMPKQTVNSLVVSYVRRGLVETKPNSHDGRSKLHVLTEAGMAKYQAICRDEQWLYSFAAESVSEEEMGAALKTLARLVSRFEEGIGLLNEEGSSCSKGGEQ